MIFFFLKKNIISLFIFLSSSLSDFSGFLAIYVRSSIFVCLQTKTKKAKDRRWVLRALLVLHFVILLCGRNKVGFVIDFKGQLARARP